MKKCWLVLVIFLLGSFTTPELNKTVLLSETEFKDGIYLFEKKAFNGNIVSYYDNETLKYKCEVFEGKLHGITHEYFPTGNIKSKRNYYLGKLFGEFSEYFEDGKLKVKGKVKNANYHGGEEIENLVINIKRGNRLKSKKSEKGKIIFVNKQGEYYQTSENIPIYLQSHYIVTTLDGKETLIEID